MVAARSRQKHYADMKRSDIQFKEGDLVPLRTERLRTDTRSDLPRKWRTKFIGPLSVLKRMSDVTYNIELPAILSRMHNVVHVSQLKKYIRPEGQTGLLEVTVDFDGSVEQEVQEILQKKRVSHRTFYLVHFKGEPLSEAVWLPRSELMNCRGLIAEFESKNPSRTTRVQSGVSVTE